MQIIANMNNMGTFRTYTVKVEGNHITFRNITIENNAPKLGQAVALHTEGDCLRFINCRFLGNQDTVYTGVAGTDFILKIVISKERPISYLDRQLHGLRIVRYTVRQILMLQLHRLLKISSMDISLITVS